MKKFFLSFLFLFAFFLTHAQVMYKHNFDAPNGAELFDSDGDAFAWALHDYKDGDGLVATSNNLFSMQPLRADNWLVCSSADLSGSNSPHLFWKAKASGARNADEKLTVYVSSSSPVGDGGTVAELMVSSAELKEVFTVKAETTYTHYQIDLSDFKGQNSIYIAFRHQSDSPVFGLNIDDVVVSDVDNPAIDVSIVAPSRAYLSSNIGSEINFYKTLPSPDAVLPISFKIGNYGSEFAGGTFNYTINGVSHSKVISNAILRNDLFRLEVSLGLGQFRMLVEVLDATGASVSEIATFNVKVSEPIPDVRLIDTYGNPHNLYDELREGKVILLDFFASWCGPCQLSTPDINEVWDRYGRGRSDFQVFGVTTEPQDGYEVINSLGWGAEYPKFAFSNQTKSMYDHFERTAGGVEAIPFFVMVCPNQENPAYSEVSWVSFGWSGPNELIDAASLCNARLAVDQGDESQPFHLYPNPASQSATTVLNVTTPGEVRVNVFNNLGQSMYAQTVKMSMGRHQVQIPIEGFEPGMYFVNVKMGTQQFSEKLEVFK